MDITSYLQLLAAPIKSGISQVDPYSTDLENLRRELANEAEIVNRISTRLGLAYLPEKEPEGNVCLINNEEVRDDYKTTFTPIDLFDYTYAILHSPTRLEKQKQLSRIDILHMTYPTDSVSFWKLVRLGCEMRKVHLFQSSKFDGFIASYPIDGDNQISRKLNKDDWEITDSEKELGRIWINDQQFFDQIPIAAWEFNIAGDQAAQKWLKDRRGRHLHFDDILYFQRMIVAITETIRLMQKIDKIKIEE